MSGRARLSHRQRPPRHWAANDSALCAAYLRALARWAVLHHDDGNATIMLPTGAATAAELARVLRAIEAAGGGVMNRAERNLNRNERPGLLNAVHTL